MRFRIILSSDRPEVAPTLHSLSLDHTRAFITGITGVVEPREAVLGVPQRFTYRITPTFSRGDLGFDRIRIAMPSQTDRDSLSVRLDGVEVTPFDVQIRTPDGHQVVRVSRGISIFLSTVEVHDDSDRVVGRFKQKLFSVGGAFDVLDVEDRVVCSLVGKWTGWDFRFLSGNRELAHVSKRWAGVGKELFTSADNYVLEINEQVSPDDPVRQLILAAVMCIDMVLKE